MRIDRLDLLAYGPFRGRSLSLGPGFHLVHGANEAGKSTTLRALSSLFFGFPKHGEDAYLVGTADMALGARITTADGRTLEFVRRRRGKSPLTMADGSVLSDELLSAFLGGLSRETFERLFSLDPARLRRHGQDLLTDGGALGQGLVEAGAGIVNLRKKLEILSARKRDLFLPTGKNPAINRILARLGEIRRESRLRMVSPQDYVREEEEIRRLESASEGIRSEVLRLEREIRRAERILRILPRRQEYETLGRELSLLEGVPLLPPDSFALRVQAESWLATGRVELDRLREEEEGLEQDRAALADSPEEFLREEEIAVIEKDLGAASKSLMDLPRREQELFSMEQEARLLLRECGLPEEPQMLDRHLPPPGKRRKIASLLDRRSALEGSFLVAGKNAGKAQAALSRAEAVRRELPSIPETGALEAILPGAEAFLAGSEERSRRSSELLRRRDALAGRLHSLGLGEITLPALRALVLPERSTLLRMQEDFRRLLHEEKEGRDALVRREQETKKRENRIASLEGEGEVVTFADLKAVRERRDAGWGLLRKRFLEGDQSLESALRLFFPEGTRPAEGFEGLLRESDRVADLIGKRSKEAVELSLLHKERDLDRAEGQALEEGLRSTRDRLALLSSEWIGHWPDGLVRLGPEGAPDRLPEAMVEWLEKRERVLAEGELIERLEAEQDQDHREEMELTDRLRKALAPFDPDPAGERTLPGLLVRVRKVMEQAKERQRRYTSAEETFRLAFRQSEEAREALREVERELEFWKGEFGKAGLEAKILLPEDPEEIRNLLEILARLEMLGRSMTEMRDRIGKMREDIRRFGDQVALLSGKADQRATPEEMLGKARDIIRRFREAREASVRRQGLEKREEEIRLRRGRQEEILDQSRRLLDRLASEAGVKDPSALPEIEGRSRTKAALLERREEVIRQVLENGEGESLEALFADCGEANSDDLNGRLTAMREDLESARERRESFLAALVAKKTDLDRRLEAVQAVDLLQEAEVERARLSGQVEAYVEASVLEGILRKGIDLFRERNQGPVLSRAGKILERLTLGRYRGLRGDFGEKGDALLLVVREDGRSLETRELSDGTLDALYLALRLASVGRHNETGEPVPFVADDLLLNLDNRRSLKALEVLSEMGAQGQVLFFTHHAHMVELAREAVPGGILRVHEL